MFFFFFLIENIYILCLLKKKITLFFKNGNINILKKKKLINDKLNKMVSII